MLLLLMISPSLVSGSTAWTAKPRAWPNLRQELGIAFALVAQRKIMADPQLAHAHVAQQLIDKIGGAHLRCFRRERQFDQQIHAGLIQLHQFLFGRGQVIRLSTSQHHAGMRKERDHHRGALCHSTPQPAPA